MATESSISPAPEGRQPVSLPPSLTIEEMIHLKVREGEPSVIRSPSCLLTSDHLPLKLSDAFQPSYLSIRNDSSKHSHHAPMKVPGAATGQTHFFVHCVSPAFEGKTRIARHRLVNQALESEFARGLHALSLKLETEKESTA